MTTVVARIEGCAREVGRIVRERPRTHEQLGIEDAESIVREYLDVNELGVALSHLLYVVHEAELVFPEELVAEIERLAAAIGEPDPYR